VSAVGATTWTLGVPIVAFALLRALGNPTPAAAGGVIVAASVVAALTASLWGRTIARGPATLPDLLLWSWFRRLQAYRTIEQGEDLLVETDPEPQVDLELLKSLAGALEILDPYTHGHSQRVERLVRRTAIALDDGLSERQIDDLCRAAILHDIGKMHVPDGVLAKNGPLNADEWALMQQHVVAGARLVAKVGEPTITEAVMHHHEAWDGSGYPLGLSGQDIPLFARIIAAADAYDAMVSARPYRASLGRASAVAILSREAGRQFDPRIVKSLISILPAPARVRVMVPIFGALGRVGQDFLAWARRSGVTALGPTVGSCAAVAVLSTALVVAPPGGGGWTGGGNPQGRMVGPAVELDPSYRHADTALADGHGGRRGSGRVLDRQAGEIASRSTAAAGDSSTPGEAVVTPGEVSDGSQGGGSGSVGGDGPDDGGSVEPDPGEGSDPDPGAPTPEPPGGGKPPEEPGEEEPGDGGASNPNDDKGPPSDPQPGKGKDCEMPPPSDGNDTHCGG
jgi:hypothetical protein